MATKKKFAANNESRKALEDSGWTVGTVEQTVRAGKLVFKRDLFNFVDLVCISPTRGVMFVQSTAGGNMSARVAKTKENPIHAIALAAGIRIQIHDWVKRAGQKERECRVLEITKTTEGTSPDHARKRIWETLRDSNKPMTDRELMAELSEDDVNNVRPEVTRLKQDGLIRECEKKICQWTGKKVRQTVICSTAYHTRPSGKYS